MSRLLQTAYYSDEHMEKQEHFHDCHQIILIRTGLVQFQINNRQYRGCSGNILLFSRYENHSVTVLSDQYERYVLQIDPQVSSMESRIFSLLSNRPQDFRNTVDVSADYSEFERLFCRILEEYSRQDKLVDDMLQSLIQTLLIMIFRKLPMAANYDSQNVNTILAVQRKLETDFARAYTLTSLSKEYNISTSSLSHLFKRITGSSVMNYLQSCRLASAKSYLVNTHLSIGEIVEKCGFPDNSNFSRLFKRTNGISPTDFRKKYRHPV